MAQISSAPIWSGKSHSSARVSLRTRWNVSGRCWPITGALLNAAELACRRCQSAVRPWRVTSISWWICCWSIGLHPYHADPSKRLVKSPKTYIHDSGLVHALLGIADHNSLAGHPVWDELRKVIENLIAAAPSQTKFSFYRTAAGTEIDLLLEMPRVSVGGRSQAQSPPRLETGFHHARADLLPAHCFVVYPGQDRYPLGEG